jgi:hypothetical protein
MRILSAAVVFSVLVATTTRAGITVEYQATLETFATNPGAVTGIQGRAQAFACHIIFPSPGDWCCGVDPDSTPDDPSDDDSILKDKCAIDISTTFGTAEAAPEPTVFARTAALPSPTPSNPNLIEIGFVVASGEPIPEACCPCILAGSKNRGPAVTSCAPQVTPLIATGWTARYDVAGPVDWRAVGTAVTKVVFTGDCNCTARTSQHLDRDTRAYMLRVEQEVRTATITIDQGGVVTADSVTFDQFIDSQGDVIVNSSFELSLPSALGFVEVATTEFRRSDSQIGDGNRDSAIDHCDLALLRSARSVADPFFDEPTYRVQFDFDLDGRIDQADELTLAAMVPPIPGDANGDFAVDLQDFQVVASNFGAGPGATLSMGDFTGDGYVTLPDFTVIQNNFGATLPDPATCEAL